eukprot:707283-Rhodomonas_salina.1
MVRVQREEEKEGKGQVLSEGEREGMDTWWGYSDPGALVGIPLVPVTFGLDVCVAMPNCCQCQLQSWHLADGPGIG